MKKKEKRMILILLIILVIVVVVFLIGRKKKDEENTTGENSIIQEDNNVEEFVQILEGGTKLNTSAKLNETKEVDGFKFENIQFTEQNGQTVLLADVTNNTGRATDFTLVDVVLKDKNGEEVVTLGGIISPLQAGEATQFNVSATLDYSNAYDFEIKIK